VELLVVVEAVLAPYRREVRWVPLNAQSPPGEVDLLDAVVAKIASAEVVPTMPGVVVVFFSNGSRGAGPSQRSY
jgi:hypothetical protein